MNEINKICKVPVTMHGGCSNINHLKNLVKENKKSIVTGIVLSSMLHYNYLRSQKKNSFDISKKWQKYSIKQLKKNLKKDKIFVR